MGKTSFNPQPVSVWSKIGLNPNSSDSMLIQILWLAATVMFQSFISLLGNMHVLTVMLLLIFLLYRLGLLDMVFNRPWLFLTFSLALMYLIMSPPAETLGVMNPGYIFFAALVSTGMLTLTIRLLKIKLGTSLHFISACTAWLYVTILLQTLPTLPYLG